MLPSWTTSTTCADTKKLGKHFQKIKNDVHISQNHCRNVQHRSPWCIAFTKTQLKLLEYGEDLKYFYKSGYGNQMSEKIGCSPVKDFYEKFEKTVNGKNSYHTINKYLISFLQAILVAVKQRSSSPKHRHCWTCWQQWVLEETMPRYQLKGPEETGRHRSWVLLVQTWQQFYISK